MSDWKEVGLGELTNLQSGFAFKSSQWTANGVPVVKIANVKPGILDLSGCSFVTEADAKRSKFLLRRGDILIGLTGYVGAVCQVKTDDPIVLNQRVGVFRPHSDKVDSGFLYQLASSKDFMNRVEAASYGSAQPNVSPKQILAFAVTVPPLAEQREIAATLGALDDKIELNRKTAATLEEMARALYRSWFVDFDPVCARAEGRAPAHMDPATAALFPDSFGEDGLPVGWRAGNLGVVARNPRNTVVPSAINPETPYIGLEHIPRRSIAIGDWGEADDVASAKSEMQIGQFLFGKLRPYFHKVGLVPVDGICSTDILVIEAKSALWREFVLTAISSVELVDHVNAASTGTRMPRAKWQDIAGYIIAFAPEEVIRAFSNVVVPMHARIIAMVHENRTLASLRDTLLPRLMSGDLRVGAAGDLLEEVA